jgi:hypothetical protein
MARLIFVNLRMEFFSLFMRYGLLKSMNVPRAQFLWRYVRYFFFGGG